MYGTKGEAGACRVVGDGAIALNSPELVRVVDIAVDDGNVRRAGERRASRRRATVLRDLEKSRAAGTVQRDNRGEVTDSRIASAAQCATEVRTARDGRKAHTKVLTFIYGVYGSVECRWDE